jgi:hypothetical protein
MRLPGGRQAQPGVATGRIVPDAREAIERWSVQGSRKAINEIRKKRS